MTNTGHRAGTDTVRLHTRERRSRSAGRPAERLRGFARVPLAPHQTKRVTITLPVSQLRFWDVTRDRFVVESGVYDVRIGSDADDIALYRPLTVRGEVIPPRDLTRTTQAQDFDGYSAVSLADTAKTGGTSVSANGTGWISLTDTALPAGGRGLTARVANPGTAAGQITVGLDDPATGPVLGTLTVSGNGDRYAHPTAHTRLAPAHGVPGLSRNGRYIESPVHPIQRAT